MKTQPDFIHEFVPGISNRTLLTPFACLRSLRVDSPPTISLLLVVSAEQPSRRLDWCPCPETTPDSLCRR
jgi:hypothetical protein